MKKIIYIIIGVGLCTAMLSCAKGHEEEMLVCGGRSNS